MKHVFIVNPAAGKKGSTEKLVAHLHKVCPELGLDYEVVMTEFQGHDTQIAQRYVERGEPIRLYACGGDGTLNGVVQAAAGHDHVAVTNIPKGTGNDFLKLFGEASRERFCDVKALSEGPQAAFDLIDCNGLLGLDIVCAGVDARIAADVHQYSALPGVTGIGAYILSLAANILFKGIARPMKITIGDRTWDEPISILCICNGRYYGGGFMPVGEAMPDDGILDTLVVPFVSRTTFLKLVGKYAKGRYKEFDYLIKDHHGAESITFSAGKPITVVVDGEVVKDTAFTVKLSERKVNFFYPEGVTWRQEAPTASSRPGYISEKY